VTVPGLLIFGTRSSQPSNYCIILRHFYGGVDNLTHSQGIILSFGNRHMITKTLILSNALTQLGHKPIISLDNPDDLTIAAEQACDMLLPAILSSGNWRFAIQIAQLAKSTMIPPTGSYWTTIYLLPAGYLRNIRIYPQNYDYEIYQSSQIYSNWNGNYWMEYAFQPDYSLLTWNFVHYFVYEIAAYLALSNAQKPEYYQVLENKRIQALAMASATDASNRPNFVQAVFPMLQQRHIGGIIGNING